MDRIMQFTKHLYVLSDNSNNEEKIRTTEKERASDAGRAFPIYLEIVGTVQRIFCGKRWSIERVRKKKKNNKFSHSLSVPSQIH